MGTAANSQIKKVGNLDLEVDIRGDGPPLLLLTGEEQLENSLPLVDELAKSHQVVIPSPPGFGRSERPDWMTRPDDIAYVYHDLVDQMGLKDVKVVGFSLGGWLAAEMATKSDAFMSKLVLVGALGVKIGGPFDVDIQDIWTQHPEKVAAFKWHDVEKGKRDFTSMSEDELTIVARNLETFARFCWNPYMHNPKLRHRLHRIKTPTLVIWGAEDGMVSADYGKAYAGLIPGARFETVANAAHYPQIEQPDAFNRVLTDFLNA